MPSPPTKTKLPSPSQVLEQLNASAAAPAATPAPPSAPQTKSAPPSSPVTSQTPNPILARPTAPKRSAPASTATHRVLHIINGEHYAGAERVQDLLATRLPDFGFDVGFACLKPGRFENARAAKRAPLLGAPMKWRLDVTPAWRIAEMIRDGGYTLIHTHTARSALIGSIAARLTRARMIHHVHSPTSSDTTHTLRNKFNVACDKWTLGKAARLIAVSPSLQSRLIANGYSENRVVYVPNGVPGGAFDENRKTPTTTWTLGMVALFRPRKGTEVLLEAIAARRAAGDDVRLRAIGPFETPEYKRQVLRKVRQVGLDAAIEWTGFTNNVQAELAKIDLFVLPSLFGEGLPMVVLEAMAAGVPVVATNVEGIPVAVRDGLEGVIVEPNDPRALANGIARFTNGALLWNTIRTNAYRRHAEEFSDRAMTEGVAEVYRDVLA